jgi:MFS family permease
VARRVAAGKGSSYSCSRRITDEQANGLTHPREDHVASPLLHPPLFRQRNFSALWWGQLVSLVGERLTYLALIGLLAQHTHAFKDARSSLLLSLLANVMVVPVLLFAPFAGAWVDRRNLQRVMVGADLLRAGIVLAVPLLYHVTHSMPPVFVLLFMLFTCGVFFLPAKSALTPEIVVAPQRLAANTWLSAAGIAATAVGSLGGGWLVDHWGWTPALYLNAATYLVSVAAVLSIRHAPPERHAPARSAPLSGYLREVREGLAAVRANPRVGLALTTLAAVWLAGGFLHVAGNLQIQRAAGTPSVSRLGVLMAVLGVGSALSAWWLNSRGRNLQRPPVLVGGLALAGAGLLVFAATDLFAMFVFAAFLMGLAAAPALMVTETLLQEATEPGLRGRVFGTRDFLMRSVLLLSVSAAGWVTRQLGPAPALLLAGALVMGVSALTFARFRVAVRTPG